MRQSTIDEVAAAAYRVPAQSPEGDGTLAWEATTMVVVTVTAAGVTGTGWTYAPAAAASFVTGTLAGVLTGADAEGVPALHAAMARQVRNAGRPGVAGYAVSAVDVALWDLKARLIGMPLARLWGTARDRVPLYGSGGFTTYDDATTVAQLSHWVHEQGIGRVKIKIGESSGSRPERDLHRVALARRTIGADAELYVDANGGYTAKQAVRVAERMAEQDVTWFEEPVSSDDLAGLRLVRERCAADVTAGEYGCDLGYFTRMCAAGAVDCLQIDATRCGGYSGWFAATAVAAGHHLQVSAHCAPNLHLPAAAATINLRHIEWFHDHQRIEAELFDGAADPGGGEAGPRTDAPGHGLTLRRAVAGRYRVA
ncbi:L-alanine-DL-glutamate epimerase-like enolase superfamily enzyme [Nonomuraea thailandensis]|uniref:L-alanine-DL-glutamate epimerase-like enolase superfamily enzyme n=1 Tax=Nonomuraea thailandensis TaxID=1188745 RepID=A0A9X2GNP7_9ACTN|nr:enolase C-terminal domain-like protein [Nonomuraea thailandensis]MCP2357643.1 L-alanine-DL-glutamate epimerase-like enolase superfamily enzyme [Nonomuraea thailandensis]